MDTERLTYISAIESRVARIKARVAELTNNMEGSNGPQAPGPRY